MVEFDKTDNFIYIFLIHQILPGEYFDSKSTDL